MIIKEPENRNSNVKNFYLTKAARVGFSHILDQLFKDTGKKILMPAYIGETDKEGSGVFDPIRENKVKYDFYSINENLSGDISDIELKIKSGDYKAILIIHYFGFIQNDMEYISQLCKDYDVVLIEDCAHSFFSTHKNVRIGEWGDICFYSIHKILPTDDGGYFQINNDKLKISGLDLVDQNISLDTIEQFVRADYSKINQIKIDNYKHYLKGIAGLNGIRPLFFDIQDGIVPLNFPVIVENGLREKLYFKLIDKNVITCALYYRMIEEIDILSYPLSYEISNSILNLPVHQDTLISDIDEILFKIQESLVELQLDEN